MHDALKQRSHPALPPARELPDGALVVALDGTERSELKTSVVLWALGAFGTGVAVGYLLGARSNK